MNIEKGVADGIAGACEPADGERQPAHGRLASDFWRHEADAGFLLALSLALQGAANIWAISGDSDGADGAEDAAGPIVTRDTRHVSARMAAIDSHALLNAHDSYT